MMKIVTMLAAGLAMTVTASSAKADGKALLDSQCKACHALTAPANPGLDHIWERKGPDLYYAGVKFNKDWLVKWLQNPTRVRPAGAFYTKHVKPGEKQDIVDEASLIQHVKLSAADAASAADELMKLTGPAGLVAKGAFLGQPVSATMGAMFFGKLRGCGSCHMTKPGSGGSSGPELYTAHDRLQPDFIYSYIKDPQKFDPKVWMPEQNLADPDLQRLTGYILSLSSTEAK